MDETRTREAIAQLISSAEPKEFRLKYERWSDMLYITIRSNNSPSTAIQLENGWLLRVNRETGDPFGFMVENAMWLASQEGDNGILFDLIERADFTDAESPELKRQRSVGIHPAGFDMLTTYLEAEGPKLAVAQ